MASGTCLMGPGSRDAVIGDKEPMAILILPNRKRPKWRNFGERCWDLRGTVEMFVLSRFANADMGSLESALPQAGERPRGRPSASCKLPYLLCHQTALTLFVSEICLTFEISSGLFVVIHILLNSLLKMTHPPSWGGPAGNETAVTLHATWILTQEMLTRPRARPPIPDLHFRAAEAIQDSTYTVAHEQMLKFKSGLLAMQNRVGVIIFCQFEVKWTSTVFGWGKWGRKPLTKTPPPFIPRCLRCAQHCHRIVTLCHDKDLIRQNTTGAGLGPLLVVFICMPLAFKNMYLTQEHLGCYGAYFL